MTVGLDQAILDSGGRDALAKRLSVHVNTIRYWESRGIPPARVPDIERVTGIPRHELRPDLWPAEAAA